MMRGPRTVAGLLCSLLCTFNLVSLAAENDLAGASSASVSPSSANSAAKPSNEEINELKTLLANQQKQIEELRNALNEQKALLERMAGVPSQRPATTTPLFGRPSLGEVASTTGMIPSPKPAEAIPAAPAGQKMDTTDASPLQLHLGGVTLTPVGFADFTSVWRSTNPGSGIGSNFGSIPFLNTVTGRNSEFRFSQQNSRIGVRIDGDLRGTHVLGYWESDFLGNPTSNNFTITNHADLFRLRLYWIDLRRDKLEFLGGQSWSMLTPNRTGISPLPGDIFYSQDIDVNYQLGLVWSRTPGFRVIYHPNSSWNIGLAMEDPEQSIGGSGGTGAATLPAALVTPYASQLNSGSQVLSVPNVMPDVEAKIAYDYKKKFHFEVAGVLREFKVYNPNNNNHYYATGGGGEVNLNFELAPGFRILTNNYWSDGGGRYIFGLAPDVAVRGDGSLAPIHSGSTVDGFEFTKKNTLLYAYYGGVYIQRYTAIDPSNGKPVGYGFSGSPNSHNRSMNEITFGFNQTFWKDARYGAINLMGQYSYLTRNPWSVALGQPDDTHLNMIMFNLRYTLPGSAPTMGK